MELDLKGKIFWDLTAVEIVGKTRLGNTWKCICACGKETKANAAQLKLGRKKSCGCRKFGTRHYLYSGCGEITGEFWSRVKGHAKAHNLALEISIKDAWTKFQEQEGRCAISGIPITLAHSTKEFQSALYSASLDRIDSNKGYVKNNIQWVHKQVNIMKMSMAQKDFIFWCQKIGKRFPEVISCSNIEGKLHK